MEDKLKPCPFCGGEATLEKGFDENTGDIYFCGCFKNENCNMHPITRHYQCESKEQAIKAWNTRAMQSDRKIKYDAEIELMKGVDDSIKRQGLLKPLSEGEVAEVVYPEKKDTCTPIDEVYLQNKGYNQAIQDTREMNGDKL